jgi:hypothetical protein
MTSRAVSSSFHQSSSLHVSHRVVDNRRVARCRDAAALGLGCFLKNPVAKYGELVASRKRNIRTTQVSVDVQA